MEIDQKDEWTGGERKAKPPFILEYPFDLGIHQEGVWLFVGPVDAIIIIMPNDFS